MSNSAFMPTVLLTAFDFQSPPQKTNKAIVSVNCIGYTGLLFVYIARGNKRGHVARPMAVRTDAYLLFLFKRVKG